MLNLIAKNKPLIFLFVALTTLQISGCRPYGPAIPVEAVDDLPSEILQSNVKGLYAWKSDQVYKSIESLAEMAEEAEPAIPYLVSMLSDKRLAKKEIMGFVKVSPIFKEAATALGEIGEKGIGALIDSLEKTEEDPGVDDDFIREAVATGLLKAKEKWGESVFRKISTPGRVENLTKTVSVCLRLSDEPGRFDKSDPRRHLKFYKHFLPVKEREGLKIFIEVSGLMGNENALPVLKNIMPLGGSGFKGKNNNPLTQFQRAAVLAQYRIKPIDIKKITPHIADFILIDRISNGDINTVSILLNQGKDPDVFTRTQEPAISLAARKGHKDIFHLLIEKGASPDIRLSMNDTLLIRAALKGDFEFVSLLVNNGADISLRNNKGFTALDKALEGLLDIWDGESEKGEAEPYLKVVKLLKDSGSPPVNKKKKNAFDEKALKILGIAF